VVSENSPGERILQIKSLSRESLRHIYFLLKIQVSNNYVEKRQSVPWTQDYKSWLLFTFFQDIFNFQRKDWLA
jgi:hypothetical protein